MDWRRVVSEIGRVLIGIGVLILLFVVYQLWGTGIHESRSQDRLQKEFSAAASEPAPDPGETPPPTPEGEAVAIIKIPRIGLEKAVVEGVGVADLKKAPGHYPSTPMPGEAGNAAIAGHRTTYGAPFNRLDELVRNDDIFVTTKAGKYRYKVYSATVVKPKQSEVLDPTTDNRLTLTTCHPKFSASQRLVIVADLVGEAVVPAVKRKPAQPADDAFSESLSGDPTARGPAILFGLLTFLIGCVIAAFGHYWRRWPSYLIGAPVFAVSLFFFFENFARLLPANV
ncbi:MAG TPA: class E sortase [Acidimicrobiales bacterium]|nr:class E sortase [Acidimicrobiales bacterium]